MKKKYTRPKCEHNRQRSICKECGGVGICECNRVRSKCRECGGGSICEHNRYRYDCPDCDGKKICKSRYEPYNTGCRTFGKRNLKGFCSHCFVLISGGPQGFNSS